MALTLMQKAILKEIKNHNSEHPILEHYNKGIKFESMSRYIKQHFDEYTITSFTDENGEKVSMAKYKVKCRFKQPHKNENNIVIYMVNIYSDGTIGVYYDGTEYKA